MCVCLICDDPSARAFLHQPPLLDVVSSAEVPWADLLPKIPAASGSGEMENQCLLGGEAGKC